MCARRDSTFPDRELMGSIDTSKALGERVICTTHPDDHREVLISQETGWGGDIHCTLTLIDGMRELLIWEGTVSLGEMIGVIKGLEVGV